MGAKKIIIIGIKGIGEAECQLLKEHYSILCFTDNDSFTYEKNICGIPVLSPWETKEYYDREGDVLTVINNNEWRTNLVIAADNRLRPMGVYVDSDTGIISYGIGYYVKKVRGIVI
jgi:FlaA1/EpsC-like NDP-sugar epimerase